MKAALWALNAVGGVAVLGSYAWGVMTQPEPARLWGAIPEAVRTPYSACMPLAALGYFAVLAYAHKQPDARMLAAMAVMLVCSAAWMPLSFRAMDDVALMPLVQAVLWGTALASLTMGALIWTGPVGPWRTAALVGITAFSFQTVVLDAVVWPRFFPG